MKKNILIIQNTLMHYRKSLYNALSEFYNITVLHSGNKTIKNEDKYKEIIVSNKKIWKFNFQKNVIKEINSGKYDVVIAMFDITWINNILAFLFHKKNVKFIWWGGWLTKNKIANYLRLIIMHKGNNHILYAEQIKKKFIEKGINPNILFVANNTVDVEKKNQSYKFNKKFILFIGSLDKRKQLDVAILAFRNIKNKISNEIKFIIIGQGTEEKKLKDLVNSNNLNDRIEFKGKITDTSSLKYFYRNAIFSISFGQAGLSVLQSLGHGVPFVTKTNAISGGEITNIKHNFNGILCNDNISSLENYMIKLCNDINYSKTLGKNAYYYYYKYCSLNNMVNGFKEAIEGNTNE